MAKHMKPAEPRAHRAWLRWLPVVAWALFIWSRSLFSGPESSEQSAAVVAFVRPLFEQLGIADETLMTFVVRKLAHFSEYFMLGVLLSFTASRRVAWPQALLGAAVACADESIQLFVPGRSGQFSDVLIDSCGMLCGLAIATLILRARPLRASGMSKGTRSARHPHRR